MLYAIQYGTHKIILKSKHHWTWEYLASHDTAKNQAIR